MRPSLWTSLLAAFCAPAALADAPAPALDKIQHIIVISLENHSFDNLFGTFPGADGLANAGDAAMQADDQGNPYPSLPPVTNSERKSPDRRFPTNLANRPFPIDLYVPQDEKTGDLVHRFYQEQQQIDRGRMDRFAGISNAGGLTMGYYDASKTGLWTYAQEYTVADHFFHAAFGGSFLNHVWQICACTPRFPDAPRELVAAFSKDGQLTKDGAVTPDGYAVNTIYSAAAPHPAKIPKAGLLPPQDMPTIGDLLSEKHVSWAWYSGGWKDALAGHADRSFQFHHQPFVYFKAYGGGTAAGKEHLRDENDFLAALKHDTLPAVSFYKPLGEFNLHPGYADIASGDAHFVEIMHAIEHSAAWSSSVVIVTFDENGGYWDHVAPPKADRWGPGTRVPALIISPFARKHFVDHTVYDSTSILKLIETRFGLQPLGARDATAHDMTAALEMNESR